MNKKSLSLLLLLGVWMILAAWIQNDIILPNPLSVASRLVQMFQTKAFYLGLTATFLRAHAAFGLGFVAGLILAWLSNHFESVEQMLLSWVKLLQTIPQISFIILLLFWFDQETSILLVVILMIFPIAYFNALESLKSIPQDYRDLMKMSHQPWWYHLKMAYLPLIKPGLLATVKTALPLSLKVTVMSEVLIHTQTGIGKMLNLARANIDMIGVFSWTISLVVLVSLETHFISYLCNRETWK